MFTVTTFYKFTLLSPERVSELRREIDRQARLHAVRGLFLLGMEGCNATLAAPAAQMESFKTFLADLPEFSAIQFKDSSSPKMPFRRFKVDLRPEIVALKNGDGIPDEDDESYVSPAQFEAMLQNDPDLVLLDTRNFYETELGMFQGALDMRLSKFSEFPNAVEKLALSKDKKVLMYCTGGIRCEKALPAMRDMGFENVYQLKGGILKYLEEFPNSRFQGECFVFDHRVAVDQHLQPSEVYAFCPHCGNPGKQEINCTNCGDECKVCDRCAESADKQSCSKNCAYHLRKISRPGAKPADRPNA